MGPAVEHSAGKFLADAIGVDLVVVVPAPDGTDAPVSLLSAAPNRISLCSGDELTGRKVCPPLLEEKWDRSRCALVTNGPHPIGMTRAGGVVALTISRLASRR